MVLNLYARPVDVKTALQLDTANQPTDGQWEALLERVCRDIDRALDRRFYSETDTVELSGYGGQVLNLHLGRTKPWRGDLISVTTLKVDTVGDGTFEKTLSEGSDYWLDPADPATMHEPATRLLIPTDRTTTPQVSAWPTGPRRVELAGTFGYSEETEDSGLTGTLSDASDTSLVASADASSEIYVGDTLLIESEQVYVSNVETTTLTVTRGVNGTTAAGHTDASLLRRVFPPEVVECVLLQATRLYREKATGYGGSVASFSEGGYSSFRASYPQIRESLSRFRRTSRLVA